MSIINLKQGKCDSCNQEKEVMPLDTIHGEKRYCLDCIRESMLLYTTIHNPKHFAPEGKDLYDHFEVQGS